MYRRTVRGRRLGPYALMTLPLTHLGVTNWHHPAGFISVTLFLIPGFPLVAARLDLAADPPSSDLKRRQLGRNRSGTPTQPVEHQIDDPRPCTT